MALTITHTKRNSVSGSKITTYVQVAFDNNYPVGGEPFDATSYGVSVIDEVRITTKSAGAGVKVFHYDATNKKIQAFGTTTQASGDAVAAGDANFAGGLTLIELANTSALLAGDIIDIAITGGR